MRESFVITISMLLWPKFLIEAKHMRYLKPLFLMLLSVLLCQCAAYDFSQRVVQQGNLLPENKFQRLQIGMTKRQVATLMGTSLLSPTFSNDRWDYAYTKRKGLGPMKVKNVQLFFSHDKLVRINRDNEDSRPSQTKQ